MPRGSNTLFADIFESDPLPTKKKGRCPQLHARRNECLIDRYYYYGKFFGLRYELLVERISNEFFISPITVPEIISENIAQLKALKESRMSKQDFTKKWPHLSW